MSLSFRTKTAADREAIPDRPHVLVTGAAGSIGRYFTEHTSREYQLRLLVHRLDDDARELEKHGEVIAADLGDRDQLRRACEGIHTIVHLAGAASPESDWETAMKSNVEGTFRLLTAARQAGVRKVIYASSIHAVSGYPADVQVKASDPVNPGDIYGVSKCCAEALVRYFAEQEGLAVFVVRIGAFLERERVKNSVAAMDSWVSRRDLARLFQHCIADDRLQFAIFHGLSNNRFKRLDMTAARELLGFVPEDDFASENAEVARLELGEEVRRHNVRDSEQESVIERS